MTGEKSDEFWAAANRLFHFCMLLQSLASTPFKSMFPRRTGRVPPLLYKLQDEILHSFNDPVGKLSLVSLSDNSSVMKGEVWHVEKVKY